MNQFRCSPCKKSFSCKSGLARHLTSHTGLKPYNCEYCGNNFSRSDSLKAHIKARHTGDIAYKCKFCGKCCTSNYQLKQHTNIHTGVKPYKCSICSKSYRHKQQLSDHKNRHEGIRPWKCQFPECDKSFVCESELKTHINYHDGVKPYQCQLCNKKFSQHCHHRAHMRVHLNLKPFKCPDCPSSFSQSSHLQTHRSLHIGVKPYQCSVCMERFRLPHTLKSHMRRHTGERPYKCHLCPMTFTQSSPLNHHIQNIHGDATFPCPTCGKKFPTRVQTRVHQKIHSPQVNRWFCVFCDKGWGKHQDLLKHIRGHIQEKPFVCRHCGEWYGSSHNKKACRARKTSSPPPPLLSLEVVPPPPLSLSEETYFKNAVVKEEKSKAKAAQKNKIFQCKICHMVAKHQYHLNGHMSMHKRQQKKEHGSLSVLQPEEPRLPTSPANSIQPPSSLSSPPTNAAKQAVKTVNEKMSISPQKSVEVKVKVTKERKEKLPLLPALLQPSMTVVSERRQMQLLSLSSVHSEPPKPTTLQNDEANVVNNSFNSNSKKVKTPPPVAFKIFQCKICNQIMRHQNHLNGHMNNHKQRKVIKKKARRARAKISQRKKKKLNKKVMQNDDKILRDPLGDVDLLDDADIEIEYATAEDAEYPIPIPIPIPINIEDILGNNNNNDSAIDTQVRFRSPSPEQSELRIVAVRHVPPAELNKMNNFRPFQCGFCNKMYKTEAELERHTEMHNVGKVQKLKPVLTQESKQVQVAIPQPVILNTVSKPFSSEEEKPTKTINEGGFRSEKSQNKNKKSTAELPVVLRAERKENNDEPPEILEIFDDDDAEDFNFMKETTFGNTATETETPTRQQRKMNSSEESLSPPILVDETRINFDQLDDDDDNTQWNKDISPRPQRRMSRLTNEVKTRHAGNNNTNIDVASSLPPAKKKKSIRCSLCRRMFGNKGALGVHIKTRHSKSQIPPQKQAIIVELNQLQEPPQQQKMLAKKYKCILCSFVTTESTELSLHAKAVHYVNSNKH